MDGDVLWEILVICYYIGYFIGYYSGYYIGYYIGYCSWYYGGYYIGYYSGYYIILEFGCGRLIGRVRFRTYFKLHVLQFAHNELIKILNQNTTTTN